jgi:hypothetical protein
MMMLVFLSTVMMGFLTACRINTPIRSVPDRAVV